MYASVQLLHEARLAVRDGPVHLGVKELSLRENVGNGVVEGP